MSSLPALAPAITPETSPFWRAAAAGSLTLPRCNECDRFIWYPRAFCPYCGADRVTWTTVTGRGHIYSCTVIRRAPHPAFASAVPYALAVVELEEGVRMLVNVVASDVDHLAIGMAVTAAYDRLSDECAIVRFRPAREG
jgi:uncharacterized OB-fold protein